MDELQGYVLDHRDGVCERQMALVARWSALERLRSDFVRNVSHEIRTPLVVILGYAELLSQGDLGGLQPRQQRAVAAIASRAGALSKMIDQMALLPAPLPRVAPMSCAHTAAHFVSPRTSSRTLGSTSLGSALSCRGHHSLSVRGPSRQ